MKKFKQMLQEQAAKLEKLKADTSYMDWLYEFTKNYPNFTTDDWLYNEEGISVGDSEKVDLLTYFFRILEEYHTKYLIEDGVDEKSRCVWYNIKYKDVYFSIGVCVGQGAFNFVKRHEDYSDIANQTYVEIENIINDTPPEDYEMKLQTLNSVKTEMKLLIEKLKQSGLPQGEIDKIIKEIIN